VEVEAEVAQMYQSVTQRKRRKRKRKKVAVV
jgi:hypothetical protein